MTRYPNTAHGRGQRVYPPAIPEWVPAEGQFAAVGLNTFSSAAPAGWPSSESAGPFINWCGAAYGPEFGDSGGFVIHGSGHLSDNAPLWAGVWVWDVATRLWVGRNIPAEPMLEAVPDFDTEFNDYYESNLSAIAGHPYPAHTYDGLVYQSQAEGGSVDGSLLRVCIGGGGRIGNRCVHQFDLSSLTAPPSRVINSIPNIANSYPMTAKDVARGGFWCTSNIGMNALVFVRFSDWSQTIYTSAAFNGQSNQNLVYIPDRDCLVATGGSSSRETRVCPIVGGVPQGWTLVTPTGTQPSDHRSGGVWSTLLQCIVSYQSGGSSVVHKLTVPADLTGGIWAWTSETLTGVADATPSQSSGGTNGAWGRFVEAPELRCFLWCDSVSSTMQAWRLSGM
jgi:hypothetical protein